jgi:hypothetical protein
MNYHLRSRQKSFHFGCIIIPSVRLLHGNDSAWEHNSISSYKCQYAMDPLLKLNPLPFPFNTSPQPPSLGPKNEIPNRKTPARMTRQPLIKLSGQFPHLWQPSPRNKRKVMMFIMIPHIVTQPIQRSVVRERFLWERNFNVLSVLCGGALEWLGGGGGEDVVFCDKVACAGMKGSSEKG